VEEQKLSSVLPIRDFRRHVHGLVVVGHRQPGAAAVRESGVVCRVPLK
jgi:hypothetical protein